MLDAAGLTSEAPRARELFMDVASAIPPLEEQERPSSARLLERLEDLASSFISLPEPAMVLELASQELGRNRSIGSLVEMLSSLTVPDEGVCASALFPSTGGARESWSDLTGLLDGKELEAP